MASICVFFEDNMILQAQLGILLLFTAILIHLLCNPYKEKMLSYLETQSLVTSIVCLTCGGLVSSESTPTDWKRFAQILISALSSIFILSGLANIVYTICYEEDIAYR